MILLIISIIFILILIFPFNRHVKKDRYVSIYHFGREDKVLVPEAYNGNGSFIKFYIKDTYLCRSEAIESAFRLEVGDSLRLSIEDNRVAVYSNDLRIGYVEDKISRRFFPVMESLVGCTVAYRGRSQYGDCRSSYDKNFIETPIISAVAFFNDKKIDV